MQKMITEHTFVRRFIKNGKWTAFLLTFVLVMLLSQLSVASATELNAELITNGGAEAGTIGGWNDGTGANRWNAGKEYSNWALPAEGDYYFYLFNATGTDLSGSLWQGITLTESADNNLFANISAGKVAVHFSISMFQNINEGNEVKADLYQYDGSGNHLKTSSVVNTTYNGTTMGDYQINTDVHPNTRQFSVVLSATLTSSGYAQFDKVSLKLVDASTGSAPVFGDDFPAVAETIAGVTYTTNFTISDADEGDVDRLTFSASSSNVGLVPAANITVGGSGANRTLTIKPPGNLSGEADITVTASDGTKSAEKTLRFIVHKDISMGTNLVENGNGSSGLAGWSGNTVNIKATVDGFKTDDPKSNMSQNIDISKYSALINTGETNFSMSAAFPKEKGKIEAQFYTDIACTNSVGSPFMINSGNASLQQKIPVNAMGVKITFSNTSDIYEEIIVENIHFQIVNDFPKIAPIIDITTKLDELTVLVHPYYATLNATLTAVSNNQDVVPDNGIVLGGSGFSRTITFTPLNKGSATLTLTLNDGNSSVSTDFNITVLEPPVITKVESPTAGFYGPGEELNFTVQFSHAITGGTGSKLPLTIGEVPVNASYLSSSNDSITYRYTVDTSVSGTVTIGSAIDDTGSPITDAVGNKAETRINDRETAITVIQPPQLTSTSVSGSESYGTMITFTATLNHTEPLSGFVQFKAGGINLGNPVAVSGNTASYKTIETELAAGSVSITAQFIPSGSNFHFTSNAYTVTIVPKPVTASVQVGNKAYDGNNNAAVSIGFAAGLIYIGDDVNVSATGAFDNANVGSGKPVTLSDITISGVDADNYSITIVPSGLTADITRKGIQISPKPITKTIGTADPAFNYSITQGTLVGSESLTGSLSRIAGEDVGEYIITQGTVTNENNPNYDITFIAGAKLTIMSAPSVPAFSNYYLTAPTDVTVPITWYSAQSITEVVYGSTSLKVDIDYTVIGDKLTIMDAYLSKLSLTDGDTLVFDITFDTGTTATLTVSVMAEIPSNNADLSSLSVNGTLVSGFDPNITEYNVKLPYGSTGATVSATADDSLATVVITTASIPGIATVTVIAEDRMTTKTYSIHFTVGAAPQKGDGGSGDNGNSSPTPTTPENPVAPKAPSEYKAYVKYGSESETVLQVTVNKDDGIASVDTGSQKLTLGETVITIPPIPDVSAYSIGLPVQDLSTYERQGTLTLNTDVGSITVASDMLTGITGINGSKAEITIGKGDKASLPDDVKAAIGVKPMISLSLSVDGKQIDWSNPNVPVSVSIPYIPTAAELQNPESIVIWYIDDNGNVVTIPNGHYDSATGVVTFSTTHFSNYAVAYNKVSFNDVATGEWYTNAISFIAARDITTGIGNGNFSPNAKLTRGEFIVLMMRAYGIAPDTHPLENFSDAGNVYYTGYLATAKRMGISAGIGNNLFAPGKVITRQEMFTLLYNTLKAISHLPQGKSGKSLDQFSDAHTVDFWAMDAMTLLAKTGTVNGNNGALNPLSTTTRAEIAQVLFNLLGK